MKKKKTQKAKNREIQPQWYSDVKVGEKKLKQVKIKAITKENFRFAKDLNKLKKRPHQITSKIILKMYNEKCFIIIIKGKSLVNKEAKRN